MVVCDDSSKALSLMNSNSSLKHIVIIDSITEEARNKAAELKMNIMTLEELKEIGKANLIKPIVNHNLYLILYNKVFEEL